MKAIAGQDFEARAEQIIEVWIRGDEYKRRRLLEFLGLPVIVYDTGGNILDINTRAHMLLGYKKRQDVVGKNFLDIVVWGQDLDKEAFWTSMDGLVDKAVYLKNAEGEKVPFFIEWYQHRGIYLGFLLEAEGYHNIKEALLVVEQRYKSVLEHALEGICIIGSHGFLAANETFASIFGYRLQEVYDLHPLDFIREEDKKGFGHYLKAILDNQILVRERLRYSFVDKFKAPVDCEVSYFSTMYEGQFALQLHVRSTQEVEYYKQKMRYIEEKYRKMLDLASEPVIIASDSAVIFANQSFYQLTGYTEEELKNFAVFEWIAPEYRSRFVSLVNRCQQGEQELAKLKIDIFTKRGKKIAGIWQLASIFYNDRPAVIISLSSIEDGEEKALSYSEESLKDRLEKRIFRIIAESSSVKEAFIDILKCMEEELPGCGFSFYIYNGNVVDVYSLLDGRSFFSVLHRSEVEPLEKMDIDCGLFVEYDLLNSSCLGDKQLLVCGYKYAARMPLYSNTKNIGVFKWAYRQKNLPFSNHMVARVVSNITLALERMLSRNKLDFVETGKEKGRDDLFRRFTLIGDIALNIAHEMRNPMTTIKGLAQMLALDNPQNADYCNMIVEEIDKADSIIRNFLRLSRDIMTDLQETEVNYLLDRILVSLWDEFLTRHVNFTRICSLGGLKVYVDRNQMEQALANILYNALEASSPGDSITIEIGKKDGFACIVFADEGEGIEEAYLEKVMEPFFTTKDNNTGLGLSISYKIIKEHGGDIKIYSKWGEGTRVEVYLPLVHP